MKHPGRPIKLTKILSCKIKRMAKNKRIGSIRKIQLTLKTKDINISLSSIHKTLKSRNCEVKNLFESAKQIEKTKICKEISQKGWEKDRRCIILVFSICLA